MRERVAMNALAQRPHPALKGYPPELIQCQHVMALAGWEIEYVDLDFTRPQPTAELKLTRADGRWLWAKVDTLGRCTIETFHRERNARHGTQPERPTTLGAYRRGHLPWSTTPRGSAANDASGDQLPCRQRTRPRSLTRHPCGVGWPHDSANSPAVCPELIFHHPTPEGLAFGCLFEQRHSCVCCFCHFCICGPRSLSCLQRLPGIAVANASTRFAATNAAGLKPTVQGKYEKPEQL